jgi:flagellar biosynthesis/type III secretory pathway protein FliH
MPLYLFKEHWEIARRKSPPVFGFMCTLDIMGYQSSQYFTVPYLVLLKALENAFREGATQINKQIKDLVLETCKTLLLHNEEFRKNTIKMIIDFHSSAEFRTADIVPSIRVFLAQLYTLYQLENYD